MNNRKRLKVAKRNAHAQIKDNGITRVHVFLNPRLTKINVTRTVQAATDAIDRLVKFVNNGLSNEGLSSSHNLVIKY